MNPLAWRKQKQDGGPDKENIGIFFDKYISNLDRTDDFVSPPWEDWKASADAPNSLYFNYQFKLRHGLIIVLGVCLVLGLFPTYRLMAILSSVCLIYLYWNFRRVRKAARNVRVKLERPTEEMSENDAIELVAMVQNNGPSTIPAMLVQTTFSGCTDEQKYQIVKNLGPNQQRKLVYQYLPDRGSGTFHTGPVRVTIRDDLGLQMFTKAEHTDYSVKVKPMANSELVAINVSRASLAMHTGNFEIETAGRSTSFLGLRPWVEGDSVRSIDWKRSIRIGELVVKDFERMCATDATIFFDLCRYGHSQFADVSSLRSMQETVLAIIECLVKQQVRLQVYAHGVEIPFGAGYGFFSEVAERVMNTTMCESNDYLSIVNETIETIPPESLAVFCFCSENLSFEHLSSYLLALDDRHVEVILVVFDSHAFGRAVRQIANIKLLSGANVFGQQLERAKGGKDLQNMISRLADRTYVLGPYQKLNNVYDANIGL